MKEIHYDNSPILEAICEFTFSSKKKWSWTFPGLFYSEIKEEYPTNKEIRGFGLDFNIPQQKDVDPSIHKYADSVERLQFWNKEETKVIQIGEHKLIINKRKPYDGWDDFSKLIEEMLKRYLEISKTELITKISLRYINKIEDLPTTIDLETYFGIHPKYPDNLTKALGPLNVQGTFLFDLYEKDDGRINVGFYNRTENTNNMVWFIDLAAYVDLIDSNIEIELINDLTKDDNLINKLHDKVKETFEACITDDLRDKLKEEK